MVRRTPMVRSLFLSISLVMANLLAGPSAPNAMGEEPINSPFLTNSMERWQTPDGKPAPAAWECQDGLIHLKRGADIPRGGNLVTKDEFGDFELSFDFKVAKSGNSGIKYRVRNYGGRWLGFEYQIYDDNSVKKVEPKNSTVPSTISMNPTKKSCFILRANGTLQKSSPKAPRSNIGSTVRKSFQQRSAIPIGTEGIKRANSMMPMALARHSAAS